MGCFRRPAGWQPPVKHASGTLSPQEGKTANIPAPGSGPMVLPFLLSPQHDGKCAALLLSKGISFYNKSPGNIPDTTSGSI